MEFQKKKDWKLMTFQIEVDLIEKLRETAFKFGHGGKRLIVNDALRIYLDNNKK